MSDLLTEAEKHSVTWRKLCAHIEARIDAHRKRNDGDLTPEETAQMRGRIKEAKAILALGDDSKNL